MAGLEYDSRRVGKDFLFFAFRRIARRRTPLRTGGDGAGRVRGGERAAASPPSFAAIRGLKWSTAGARWPPRLAISIGRPDERVQFTGITGTNGKTTTSYLIDAILRAAGFVTGLIGTIEYRLAGESRTRRTRRPNRWMCMRLAAELEQRGGTHLHHGSFLARPRAGQGLRLSISHRGVHQSHARSSGFSSHHGRVRGGQAAAVRAAGSARRRSGRAECRRSGERQHDAANERRTLIWYGLSTRRRSARGKHRSGFDGLRFDLSYEGARQPIESPLVGRINVLNILAAAGAGLSYGIDLADDRARESRSAARCPGRFERVDAGQPFLVVVDYAHTDDALRNVIQVARELTRGPRDHAVRMRRRSGPHASVR